MMSGLSQDVTTPGTYTSCAQSVPRTGQELSHRHVLPTCLRARCFHLGRKTLWAETPPPRGPHSLLRPGTVSGLSEHAGPPGLSDQCQKKPSAGPRQSRSRCQRTPPSLQGSGAISCHLPEDNPEPGLRSTGRTLRQDEW